MYENIVKKLENIRAESKKEGKLRRIRSSIKSDDSHEKENHQARTKYTVHASDELGAVRDHLRVPLDDEKVAKRCMLADQ